MFVWLMGDYYLALVVGVSISVWLAWPEALGRVCALDSFTKCDHWFLFR